MQRVCPMVRVLMEAQGNLSRQEAVSMIPPLLLDVEPHHLVSPLLLESAAPS